MNYLPPIGCQGKQNIRRHTAEAELLTRYVSDRPHFYALTEKCSQRCFLSEIVIVKINIIIVHRINAEVFFCINLVFFSDIDIFAVFVGHGKGIINILGFNIAFEIRIFIFYISAALIGKLIILIAKG